MGIFEQFPYTNFHEVNLDWLMEQVRDNAKNILKLTGAESISAEDNDIVIVKYTKNASDSWIASKTVEELEEAVEANKILLAVVMNGNEIVLLPRYTYTANAHRFIFSGFRALSQVSGSDIITISTATATSRNISEGVDPDTVTVALNRSTIQAYVEEEENNA